MSNKLHKNDSFVLIVAVLLMFSVDFLKATNDYLDITILHSNDMHSKFAPWDGVGGFARTAHVVKEHRQAAAKNNSAPSVLYFNAGDVSKGSRWFNLFKSDIVTEFMNALKPDAMVCDQASFSILFSEQFFSGKFRDISYNFQKYPGT